jgi:hypothetical protein
LGKSPAVHHALGDDPFMAVDLDNNHYTFTPGIAQQVAALPPIPQAPRRGRNRQPVQVNAAAGPSRLPAVVNYYTVFNNKHIKTNHSIASPSCSPYSRE